MHTSTVAAFALAMALFPGQGFLKKVGMAFLQYGLIGLFGITLLDSAFVPLPGGPDGALVVLAQTNNWMLAVVIAVIGSVIGCAILYRFSAAAGEAALRKFNPEKLARARRLLERFDILTVLVAALLPPPFPFKIFVVSAGVFQFRFWRFVVGIGIGRSFRYCLLGYLAFRYGEQAKEIFKNNYPIIGLGLAGALIAGFILYGLLKRKRAGQVAIEPHGTS